MSTEVTSPGPRLLVDFIGRHGITHKDAAAALGVSRVTLWSWLKGETSPAQKAREDIRTWTGGAVPETSWPPLTDRRKGGSAVKPFVPGDTGPGKDAA